MAIGRARLRHTLQEWRSQRLALWTASALEVRAFRAARFTDGVSPGVVAVWQQLRGDLEAIGHCGRRQEKGTTMFSAWLSTFPASWSHSCGNSPKFRNGSKLETLREQLSNGSVNPLTDPRLVLNDETANQLNPDGTIDSENSDREIEDLPCSKRRVEQRAPETRVEQQGQETRHPPRVCTYVYIYIYVYTHTHM